MAGDSETISFRVPSHVAKQLQNRGAALKLSRNEYARRLVQDSLDAPSINDLLLEIEQIKVAVTARQVLDPEAIRDLSAGIASELGRAVPTANFDGSELGELKQASQRLSSSITEQYRNIQDVFHQIVQLLRSVEQRSAPRPATTTQIDELHESLATAVAALLIRLGNVEAHEAEAWARKNLLRIPPQ